MEISAVTFFPRHTRLTIRFRHHLYSSQLPDLAENLFAILPSLRDHLCFNRNGLRFEEEIIDTELGHVFEHLILAILHRRGMHIRGQTTWNWQRDPLGTYHVTICTGKKIPVKESLLIAQAIFTNALVGPTLSFSIPEPPKSDPRQLGLFVKPDRRQPARLLFGADSTSLNATNPGGRD